MTKKVEIKEKEIEAPWSVSGVEPYELPEGWKWVSLGEVFKVLNGYSFKSDNYVAEGIRIIRITNVQDGFIEDLKPCFYPNDTVDEIHDYLLYENDLLISLTGNVGRIALLPKEYLPAALNQRVACLRPCFDNILKEFFAFYLRQPQFINECIKSSKGTAQLNMSTEWLKRYPIPLPSSIAEQQRIVSRIENMFAKLDKAKEKAQNVVDSFETRKAAILHQAFTGNLTAKWRKENGISDESWREKTLGELCAEIKIGPFGSLLHEEDYIENGIPLVNPKHISNLQIFPDRKVSISERKAEELASYKIHENDIVLGRRGEMGRCAPVGKKENGWLCGTGSMILRLKPEYLASIYSLFISSHASVVYLEENAVGSTLKNLNEKIVKSLPLPAISVPEQQEIVRILDTVLEKERTAKSAAEQVLEQIDLLKKSILARAFRGEL